MLAPLCLAVISKGMGAPFTCLVHPLPHGGTLQEVYNMPFLFKITWGSMQLSITTRLSGTPESVDLSCLFLPITFTIALSSTCLTRPSRETFT